MPSPPSKSHPASPSNTPSSSSHPPITTTTTTTTTTSNSTSNSPPSDEEEEPPSRFPPSEEASLLTESNQLKTNANTTFTRGDFSTAITQYDKALASCPNYLDYEIAVLKSNIAACHLKLAEWKAAVAAADAALEGIERVTKRPSNRKQIEKKQQQQDPQEEDDGSGGNSNQSPTKAPKQTDDDNDDNDNNNHPATVIELDPSEDETTALHHLQQIEDRHRAIARIKAKSLMRRARAKSQLGGWANLQAALDDYTTLSHMPGGGAEVVVLPPQDRKVVQAALRELPAQVARAREAEMGEMMGKLKELGNSVLKPFGLSTDMFKMQKDEKTGGYSMSVNQEN